MFALICELPSSLCGWSRLINNNSSWRRRNNSPKNKKRLWIKTRCKERDRRRRNGRFLSADWSFVTQIGADEVQRRMTVPATTTHGFVSWRPAALMWATSSALIQEVTAAGREGSPDTTGLEEEDKTWTLERWQRFIFMQTSSMYSCCGDNGVLSGVTSSSGRHVGGLKPMQFNQEASSCANQEVPSTDSFFTCTTERRHHQALLLVSFVQI